ncbi:MAG: carboxymuconolactone decarboxylase family protein [Desulfomonilia bacterium]|jgi:alkylhydroperoxidase family enzyme
MSPYIPLPSIESLPQEIKEIVQAFPLNIFLMTANAPASFKGLGELARSILFESEFDPRKREIAVLRVAHVTRAIYEWTHHVAVAKLYGLTDNEIEKIKTEDPVISLDDEGNLLCRVADEISRNVRLGDEALTQTLNRYGVRGATELILCISYFNMVSRFLESTRVPLEKDGVFNMIHKT